MSFHDFRGQHSAKPAERTRGFSQATMRTSITTFDQFGRSYTVPVEKSTGMPCGLPDPNFWSPWVPDFHLDYWMINPDNTSQLFLNLRKFVADRIRAMREYHARAARVADKKGWPMPTLGEYSDDIISAAGTPPRAYQLAVALEQENPWVLGETEIPDPRLEKFLESPSREIEDALDFYDFGRSSYASEVGGTNTRIRTGPRPAPAKPQLSRFAQVMKENKNRARPAAGLDLTDADAVAAAYAGEAAGEAVGEESGEFDAEDAFIAENETAMDDLSRVHSEEGDGTTVIEDFDELDTDPTERDHVQGDEAEEMLLDIEEAEDREALGGRRVRPSQTDRTKRQAPRSPSATSVPRKRASHPTASTPAKGNGKNKNRAFNADKRPSLADGARPVISDS